MARHRGELANLPPLQRHSNLPSSVLELSQMSPACDCAGLPETRDDPRNLCIERAQEFSAFSRLTSSSANGKAKR